MPKGSAITPQEPSESTIAFYQKAFNSIDKKNTGKIQVDQINDLMEITQRKKIYLLHKIIQMHLTT